MSRSLPKALAVLPLLAALTGAVQAQTITAGSIPASPNFGFNPTPVVITAVDLTAPATGSGNMTTAAFVWSLAPCPASVKIKFFRRSGDTLFFLAERGPFDVNATTQAVALSPPVSVQEGDLVGITRVASCGSPVGLSPGGVSGLVAFGSDIAFNVSISSGTTATNSTLAVIATGTATGAPPSSPAEIIPVVISSPGLLGANFHTAVQLYNPTLTIETGSIVFHAQSVPGSASDPSMAYSINPGQTLFFADALTSLGQTGIGSLDLVATTGSAPVASVRVYNDAGAAGTSGFTEHGLKPSEALSAGARGILIGPFDPLVFRYNVGVRTLSTGATISITVRDAAGNVLRTLARSYPANFFQQTDVLSFLGGLSLAANQTVTVDVVSGSLFVYGATADDRTNDPALDFARAFRSSRLLKNGCGRRGWPFALAMQRNPVRKENFPVERRSRAKGQPPQAVAAALATPPHTLFQQPDSPHNSRTTPGVPRIFSAGYFPTKDLSREQGVYGRQIISLQ